MLEDCKPKAILTYKARIKTNIPVINLESSEIWKGSTKNLINVNTPENSIYCIYTSGTTGNPNGVILNHKNVIRLLKNNKFQFDFNEKDVWSMFHSYCFDFSVLETFGATLNGGKIVIVPSTVAKDSYEFLRYIEKYKISVLNQVPSSFYHLMNTDSRFDKMKSVRYLIFGAEALNPQKLHLWHKEYTNTKIINMYGITETTVHVTYKEINDSEIERGISDIGKAIPTLQTYIMNDMSLCGIGMPGELCVAGEGVAEGYLNKLELPAEKFIDNPFGEGKMYRSGDLARWLPNGDIEYLGRIDDQVKIRGFRIELGEIESVIRKIDCVKDVVVISRKSESEDIVLSAYIVSNRQIQVKDVRKHIRKELPQYMVPEYITQIEKIPVTTNGKLDRKALPKIEAISEKEYMAPRTKIEEKIGENF